jgi:hypothetical protein
MSQAQQYGGVTLVDDTGTISALELALPPRPAEYTPPALLSGSLTDEELRSQATYVKELEQLLIPPAVDHIDVKGLTKPVRLSTRRQDPNVGVADTDWPKPAHPIREATSLRKANRALSAKVGSLQAMLDAAHARCRRSEEINAQWRKQHGQLRARDHEASVRMCSAQLKAERTDSLLGQVGKLREEVRARHAEAAAWRMRCSELESTVAQQRTQLASLLGEAQRL